VTRLFFSNTANSLSLSAGVVPTDTVLLFSGTETGWPGTPCKAVIDPETDLAEVVLVTAIGPSSFTVVRGQDGTTAQTHSSGATVEHRWSAAEADEANLHANLNGGVHGIVGDVVGTDDVQTLENKHLVSPTVDTATLLASDTSPAAALKAATTGAANIAEFQDPSGVALTRVGQHGEVAVTVTDAATSPLSLKMAAAQTADGLQLRKSDNSIPFKVDKDGDLTAASLTTAGAASTGALTAASVASSGPVSGTTGTFSGAVSASSVTASGSMSASTIVTGDVVRRVARNADGTSIVAGGTEVMGNSHGYPVVNGRRYRAKLFATTTAQSGVTIRQLTLRVSSGTVTNTSQLIEAMQRSYNGGSALRDDFYFEGEFVATSTGTWNVAVGVSTQGGAGQTTATTTVVTVEDVGT
jgi:Fibronectin type III protein.